MDTIRAADGVVNPVGQFEAIRSTASALWVGERCVSRWTISSKAAAELLDRTRVVLEDSLLLLRHAGVQLDDPRIFTACCARALRGAVSKPRGGEEGAAGQHSRHSSARRLPHGATEARNGARQ